MGKGKRNTGTLLSRVVIWGTSFTLLALIVTLTMIIILPTTGHCAFEQTTEPEPQLNIRAGPSVPELNLSTPYEQASLPMAALSYDRGGDLDTRPPKSVTQAPGRSFPEAVPGRSGERDEEKRGEEEDLTTAQATQGGLPCRVLNTR
ncbi:hypothetical protein MTO96_006124 [Rhipicephalus appendiculatus]